jgi:hypothetical protein
MRSESLSATLARAWCEYLRSAAAFDLALVSLFAVVALGFRHAFAAGLWVGILASIVLRSRVRTVERIPRAVLLRVRHSDKRAHGQLFASMR